MIDEKQIRLAIDLIKNNGLVEVRVMGSGKFDIYSGYFKNVDNLINEVKRFDKENIYFVLNEIDDACYSREQQERIQKSKNTTSDGDIIGRTWIFVDIDAERPSGVGATEEEKDKSRLVGHKVYKFLRDIGFTTPVSADSGNGYHLLYPIKLANTPDNTQLIKDFLHVLDMFFSNKDVKIDLSVFNASRTTRLYGTVCQKGKSTPERPHRVSEITKAPDEIKPTDISLIRKVADMKPKKEVRSRHNNYSTGSFDLEGFISKHGIQVQERADFSGGKKIVLDHCLFDHSHKGKDAAFFQLDNGAISYKCFHNSCSSYKWQDVRKMYEPNAYSYKNRAYDNFGTKPTIKKKNREESQNEIDIKGEKFLEFSEIKEIDRNNLVYIKTHLYDIDKKMIGLLKGELSIFSGLSASGKSTILGQLALNAINDGFKVGFYSGELSPSRVKNWIQLQAAGRQFCHSTQYETMFYVKNVHKKLIDQWIKGRFFLYNNMYGNNYSQMYEDIEEQIVKEGLDMIVMDNIMTLNLDGDSFNANEAQTKAVQSLSDLAKKHSVHIILVAHPRKTVSFLRAEDISGSGNIRNLADNIFIVHRCNKDFAARVAEYLGEAEASRFEDFNNVLEIAKNRDFGIADVFVGLYFEVESKRFLNEPYENIIYGWQELLDEPLPAKPEMKPNLYSFDTEKSIIDAPF